jgi:hypothetical protein
MNTILPIFLIVVAAGIFVGYTDPAYHTALTNKTEASAYDTALGDSKQLVSIRDSLLTKYNSISEDERDRLTSMLPDSVDNIRLILEIANIAARYGMVPKEVSFGNGSAPTASGQTPTAALSGVSGPIGTISMTFVVSGSYADFQQFLSDVSQSLRLMDVSSIQFSTGTNDFTDYKVTLTAYWLTPTSS